MNGYCKTLSAFFGPQFDPNERMWFAIKVYRDGNPIEIGGPFETEDEAEACANAEHKRELKDNGQFGVGA